MSAAEIVLRCAWGVTLTVGGLLALVGVTFVLAQLLDWWRNPEHRYVLLCAIAFAAVVAAVGFYLVPTTWVDGKP